MNNKRRYIRHYKNGSLKYMIKIIGYDSQKQIKFLEELIKQDLDNNKSKTKEKQKTLTK